LEKLATQEAEDRVFVAGELVHGGEGRRRLSHRAVAGPLHVHPRRAPDSSNGAHASRAELLVVRPRRRLSARSKATGARTLRSAGDRGADDLEHRRTAAGARLPLRRYGPRVGEARRSSPSRNVPAPKSSRPACSHAVSMSSSVARPDVIVRDRTGLLVRVPGRTAPDGAPSKSSSHDRTVSLPLGVRGRREVHCTDGPADTAKLDVGAKTREARDPVVLGSPASLYSRCGTPSQVGGVWGAPVGVIHSLLPWSSGRAAWSGQPRMGTNGSSRLDACGVEVLAELERLAGRCGRESAQTSPARIKTTNPPTARCDARSFRRFLQRPHGGVGLRTSVLLLATYVRLMGC
jgi:hypothetical protein